MTQNAGRRPTRRGPHKKAVSQLSEGSGQTITRYMDAAEALFIELGYEGASIRAISARAGMTVGTVVYHFGTKEVLFREICLRRFGEIQEEQLKRLRRCEARWETLGSADLTPVLRALVVPPLTLPGNAQLAQTTRLLYGRVLTDPSPVALRVASEVLAPATLLFHKLVQRCLRHLDADIFHWRYVCAVGSFIIAQSFERKFTYALGLTEVEPDWQIVAEEIVQTMAAGLLREKPARG